MGESDAVKNVNYRENIEWRPAVRPGHCQWASKIGGWGLVECDFALFLF